MRISLVAIIDNKNGIGKNNQLLCHLPNDLRYFKMITMGKPILMGRKTFESIGKPLPGRQNIILSHQPIIVEGATVVKSLEEAYELVAHEPELMVIGGATLYEQTLPHAHQIYLTVIDHQFEADVFFPKLDKTIWNCTYKSTAPKDEKNKYDLTFYKYERK